MNASDCVPGSEVKLTDFACLTRGESIGLFGAMLAPIASWFAVTWLLGRIITNVVYCMRKGIRWQLVGKPIEAYLLSLFIGEFVESFSSSLSLRWVIQGRVWSGQYCTAQGFVVTVGETAVALTTIAIAIHTFIVVWVDKEVRSLLTAWVVVVMLWIFDITFSLALFLKNPDFYTPTPYWCWVNVSHKYLSYRLLVFYAWLWLAMVVSFLGYLPLYFFIRGYITRETGQPWWKFNVRRHKGHPCSFYMICYPLIYCVLGLPLSAARWAQFVSKHGAPPSATLATSFIFDLSGLFNVLLFVYTRKGLLLFDKPIIEGDTRSSADDFSMQSKWGIPAGERAGARTTIQFAIRSEK